MLWRLIKMTYICFKLAIFKSKTKAKIQSLAVAVALNEKEWLEEGMINLWLTKCYTKRLDDFFRACKALFVTDSIRVNTDQKLNSKFSTPYLQSAPGGSTKTLEPLVILVNHSFKTIVRDLWEQWMMIGEHRFTATGRMGLATVQEVIRWIDKARASVLQWFQRFGVKLRMSYFCLLLLSHLTFWPP